MCLFFTVVHLFAQADMKQPRPPTLPRASLQHGDLVSLILTSLVFLVIIFLAGVSMTPHPGPGAAQLHWDHMLTEPLHHDSWSSSSTSNWAIWDGFGIWSGIPLVTCEVFWTPQTVSRPQSRLGTHWRNFVFQLDRGGLSIPSEELV